MIPLQYFAQKKLGVLENIETFEDYKNTSFAEKFEVRNALFENINLIDAFIDENPRDISHREPAVGASWKRLSGANFISNGI